MSDREYMIGLIRRAVGGCAEYWAGLIADCLIAHGAVFKDWHSAECLPTEDGVYWVYANGMTSRCNFAIDGDRVDYELSGRKNIWFYWDSKYGALEKTGITHWMPLPKDPEVKV